MAYGAATVAHNTAGEARLANRGDTEAFQKAVARGESATVIDDPIVRCRGVDNKIHGSR